MNAPLKFMSEGFLTEEEALKFKDDLNEACMFDSMEKKDGYWYVWYLYDNDKGFEIMMGAKHVSSLPVFGARTE